MDQNEASRYAETLHRARATRRPRPPLTADRPLSVDDAYLIQSEFVSLLQRDGDEIAGYKLGLTSRPMQDLFGVKEPDYGPILRSMVHSDGAAIESGRFIQPRIEAEIAVVLGADLRGPNVTAADATKAVRGAVTALEIIDSRIEDWKITLPDTVADLASTGAVVLADRPVPVEDFDLRLVGLVLERSGDLMATGAGAAALGSPYNALAWLANTLSAYDVTLPEGCFVMTGALHAAFPIAAGDRIHAEADRLGPVSVVIC